MVAKSDVQSRQISFKMEGTGERDANEKEAERREGRGSPTAEAGAQELSSGESALRAARGDFSRCDWSEQ